MLPTLTRPVRAARRRLFAQALVTRLAVAWAVALALGGVWVAALPYLVDTPTDATRWAPVGGLLLVATLAGFVWARRATPTAGQTALEVDGRFNLDERLTTALSLGEADRGTPAGAAVLADAAAKVAAISVRERFPVRARWHLALVPAAAALLALATVFPVSEVAALLGETPLDPGKSALASTAAKKADAKPLVPFTQRNKPPELDGRKDKSKELKELEEQINQLMQKYDTDPNRESPEKLKEKVAEMTALQQKAQEFQKQKLDKLEKLEQQLQQLDRLNKDQDFQQGPAKKLNDALAKGDLKAAKEEIDQLRKKAKEKKLDADDQQKLAKQLDKMKKAAEQLKSDKDRTEKVQAMLDKAKQEGRSQDAESLERELGQLKQQQKEAAEATKELAEKFEKAKDALEKGNLEEAAKELGEMAQQMSGTEADLKDLEDVQDYLQRLKDDKKSACKKCQGDCDGEGDKDDAEWTPNGKQGSGRRKLDESAQTDSMDERIRGLFDPRGKKTYGGSTKGPAFKTASAGELGPAIKSSAQSAPAAVDSQRLPRDAQDTVKDYFQNLGGQK